MRAPGWGEQTDDVARYSVGWSWFAEFAGQVVDWKAIAQAPVRVTSLPKGIYKPEGAGNPALSVKQTLRSPYHDIEPVHFGDTWIYQYHQEGGSRDLWTNKGLLRAMELRWPVGVLRQVTAIPARYRVLGLARVAEWRFEYFVLQGLTQAESLPFLEMRASPPTPTEGVVTEALFDPTRTDDQRVIRLTPTVIRQGQTRFRQDLLRAYGGACAISRYDAPATLQAAHIAGYAGPPSNILGNGLLLRADLHLLFDVGLAAIDGETYRVVLHPSLETTKYVDFSDERLLLPASRADWPSGAALDMHRQASGL